MARVKEDVRVPRKRSDIAQIAISMLAALVRPSSVEGDVEELLRA